LTGSSPLTRRSLLDRLWNRFGENPAMATFSLVSGFVSIGLVSMAAQLSHAPLVFPALGGTAFLMFSRPLLPSASPRNVVIGHLVGCACGWVSLELFGPYGLKPQLALGLDLSTALPVAMSFALTAGILVRFGVDHPPAAATSIIVSLGLLDSAPELGVVMLGVALLVCQAIVMNRRAGFAYPLWRPVHDWTPGQERSDAEPAVDPHGYRQ
jgi:CBS domain-containing membrane protein